MDTEASSIENTFQVVRGIPYPALARFKRKNIEDAMDHVPRDGDVIITSYPKTGTTWMQYIVMQIVSKATVFSKFDDVIFKLNPYIEMVGVAALEALIKPRIYKHHMPSNVVQKNEKSKSIYTYRHPEDVVVSYYHFSLSVIFERPVEFDEFFDNFVTGNISYGSYFSHVLSFYEHRNDSNLLMVSYEKLHSNKIGEILRIAKFLGDEHHVCLFEQEDVMDKIMEHTSFEYMKKNLYLTHPDQGKDGEAKKNIVPFFRKGVVGEGKSKLTEEQRQRLKEFAGTILEGTSILQEWYKDEI